MEKELKITKDRVLKAAEKCSTAKETLKELFPEAFEDECKYKIYRDNDIPISLYTFVNQDMEYNVFTLIPGQTPLDKCKAICKLIEKTWLTCK